MKKLFLFFTVLISFFLFDFYDFIFITFSVFLFYIVFSFFYSKTNGVLFLIISSLLFSLVLKMYIPSVSLIFDDFSKKELLFAPEGISNPFSKSILINTLYFIPFIFGFYISGKNINKNLHLSYFNKPHAYKNVYLSIAVILSLFIVIVRLIFPIQEIEFQNSIRIVGVTNKLPFLVSQLKYFILIAIAASYKYKLISNGLLSNLLFYSIFITSVSYFGYLGNRGNVFHLIITVGLIYFYEKKNLKILQLGFFRLILITVLFSVIYYFTTLFRFTDQQIEFSLFDIFNRLGTFISSPIVLFEVAEKVNINSLSFLKSILAPIPSVLIPFYDALPLSIEDNYNSDSLGNLFFYLIYGKFGGGIAIPLSTEFIWRFGYFISPLIILLYGMFLGKIFTFFSRILKSEFLLASTLIIFPLISQEGFVEGEAVFCIRLFIYLSLLLYIFKKIYE